MTNHSRRPQMAMLTKRRREPHRHRHVPQTCALWSRHVTPPIGPLDAELPLAEIDVAPLEREDLAQSEAGHQKSQPPAVLSALS